MSPVRRRFLEFIVSVAALHVIAIAAFYALDIRHAAMDSQRVYAWTWMGLTVALVFLGLQRIKRARRGNRL